MLKFPVSGIKTVESLKIFILENLGYNLYIYCIIVNVRKQTWSQRHIIIAQSHIVRSMYTLYSQHINYNYEVHHQDLRTMGGAWPLQRRGSSYPA